MYLKPAAADDPVVLFAATGTFFTLGRKLWLARLINEAALGVAIRAGLVYEYYLFSCLRVSSLVA